MEYLELNKKLFNTKDKQGSYAIYLNEISRYQILTDKAEANFDLIKTIDLFNPELGCRFPTYAVWWVKESFKSALFHCSRVVCLSILNRYGVFYCEIKMLKELYENLDLSNEKLGIKQAETLCKRYI
ncbi:hypothetical protein [Aliivibrio finisterrensis]|uniref:Uncharacterized protein n=1 Tax=Aliivibrio finisterrensis TaxID=511998 RepID=A0A6N6RWD0_9GAMM|nr:hypothetical protein [Aliivibrio finisterrensis]KAB2826036.1 hypothetical protein F8B77_02135 [Aliivibrio finisterrensis]